MARPEQSPVRIVMIGRFADQKDHATLFHALAGLMDRAWSLDLIGCGPGQSKARELAAELHIADRISFMGMRTDISKLLARAQIYVLCSRWEGLPRSIIEAMRAGLPVVASDVGGVSEIVKEGSTGSLVPRGDVGVLTARIRQLLGSPEQRLLLGKEGRSRYETGFTFERMFERTFDTYREVLGIQREPSS